MITFENVATQAYRMAGVLKAAGRGMSPEQQVESQEIANAMLDGLKIERCFVYQVIRTEFDVVADQQDYLVGAADNGSDWLIEPPNEVFGAGFVITNAGSTPSEIQMEVVRDFRQWQLIVCKEVGSTMPRAIYYRQTIPTTGTGTAQLWPKPTADGTIALYTPGTLDEIQEFGAELRLVKGFREFFMYQLACNVHDRYPELPWNPMIERRAGEYRSRIMAAQTTPLFISCDDAALGRAGSEVGRRWFDARTWTP